MNKVSKKGIKSLLGGKFWIFFIFGGAMKESIKKDIFYMIEDIEDLKLLKKIKFILIGYMKKTRK